MRHWYFRMQQKEVEQFSEGEHNERLIFESIKSYSGNGSVEVTLSLRDIALRATISYPTVFRCLPKLLANKSHMVQKVGEKHRIGGTVATYKVLLLETLKSKRVLRTETVSVTDRNSLLKKSVSSCRESVSSCKESVSKSGATYAQPNNLKPNIYNKQNNSKNNLSPLTVRQITEIALEMHVDTREVARVARQVLNPENIRKYKHKTTYHTVRKWIDLQISRKEIQTLDENGMMALNTLYGKQ